MEKELPLSFPAALESTVGYGASFFQPRYYCPIRLTPWVCIDYFAQLSSAAVLAAPDRSLQGTPFHLVPLGDGGVSVWTERQGCIAVKECCFLRNCEVQGSLASSIGLLAAPFRNALKSPSIMSGLRSLSFSAMSFRRSSNSFCAALGGA